MQNWQAFWSKALTLISGNLLGQLISILALPLLARLYLPEAFGLFGVFVAAVAVMVVLVNGGYEAAIMLPDAEEAAHQLLILSLRVAFVIFCLIGLLVWLCGPVLMQWAEIDGLRPWHLLIPLSILLEGLVQASQMALNRIGHYRVLAMSKTLRSALTVALSIWLGWLHGHFYGLIIGFMAGQFGQAMVGLLAYHFWHRPLQAPFEWQRLRALARQYSDFPTYAISSAWLYSLSKHLPFFLLPRMFDQAVAGQFSKAERVLNLPAVLVAMPIGRVFYEEGSVLVRTDQKAFLRLCWRTFWRLFWLGLPFLGVIMMWGPELFGWVLGEVWTEAGHYARWLMPWVFLSFIASPLSYIVDIKRKLPGFMWFNLGQLIIRLVALLVGGWYFEALQAMMIFGASGVLTVGLQLFYLHWMTRQ